MVSFSGSVAAVRRRPFRLLAVFLTAGLLGLAGCGGGGGGGGPDSPGVNTGNTGGTNGTGGTGNAGGTDGAGGTGTGSTGSPGGGTGVAGPSTPPVQSIEIDPPQASLAKGRSQQFRALARYADGGTEDITGQAVWSTTEPDKVELSPEPGKATALGEGEATIVANYEGQAAIATMTVTAAEVDRIAIEPAEASLPLGLKLQFVLRAHLSDGGVQDLTQGLTWTSSNGAVAQIDSTGLAEAMRVDQTSVSVICTAGICAGHAISPALLTVTVEGLTSMTISTTTRSITVGDSAVFTAHGTFSNGSRSVLGTNVVWTSDNPAVLTFDGAHGTGRAAGEGIANVTATVLVPGTGITVTSSARVGVGPRPFTTAGAFEWTVPAGVNSITVTAVGGGGGGSQWLGSGGHGGSVTATRSVAPGTPIRVVVGGGGSSSESGGGGGGASQFDAGSANQIIAGGGGGSGSGAALPGGNGGHVVDASERFAPGAPGIGFPDGNGGQGGADGNGGTGGTGALQPGNSGRAGNGGYGGFGDWGTAASGSGEGTGRGGDGAGQSTTRGGGGGGGGHGGGGGGGAAAGNTHGGAGGGGGSTGPAGSRYSFGSNGGSWNLRGGNGSIRISVNP